MPKHWKEDQVYLLKAIPAYRTSIAGKSLEEAKQITKAFAEDLHRNNLDLQHRSLQSIIERLPYLDNLLAGVFEPKNYAKKDQLLYHSKPRKNDDRKPNLCNTRHSYNGAIR
ncbi:hypothetical protein AWH56_016040 [Anaerobacillus isosaccharinicus]|uniref:Uncharacterized protein n=1 Tax=Anaerobacillus isosaccharinicus TaxID=1532552 RepID=A0A1S2LPC7_9BACI|nr:hypothetical protein [Anaerobacillus isosaccharinicus]MBA5587589.1 hypothetical protein [Anaerobacillus isosaccharinicus]QOY34235.1 hypothetical protein AWH56_016040 [Anaerobacillus isosaccharinicus]